MATCYICGKSHAEYRREVKTGNSYRTGISSRGRTSYSTQSHYGPRCVCAECALKIDYNSKKSSGGASFFYGLCFANIPLLFFWAIFGGVKGFCIGCILCVVFLIIGLLCKKSKEAEADEWYEANKGQYVDNIDIKEIATASQKFAKILEKGFNTLIDKIFRFKDSANRCLVTSKNPNDFKGFYEDCNSVIGYIDSFINQAQEEIRKFNDNIRQQYGSKDIVNKALNDCSSSWKNIIDTLVKEKSEIQQLQKSFVLDENITGVSTTSKSVSTNIPLGYKTADVFDQNFWNQQFWENVTVEQVQHSSPNGYKNTNSEGLTALFYAAFYSKNVEVIKALIDKGCDVNAKDNKGLSIPFYLLNEQYYNIENFRTILSYNFDINQIYKNETILSQALKFCPKFELIKTLIEFGADVNIPDSNNALPIDLATKKEVPIEILKLLLNMGCNIIEENQKYTALTRAALIQDNSEKIELLINKGFSVNHLSEQYNNSILCLACTREKNESNIITLLKNGADINLANDSNQTPLILAIAANHPENSKVLIENNADITICDENKLSPFMYAATMGDIETMKLLVAKGADVNHCGINGVTAVFQCTQAENANEVIDYLIESGADLKHETDDGCNVFWTALSNDLDVSFISKLIENGVDINKIDKDGDFPLEIALLHESHPDVIQLLLDNGADKNMKDKNGNTMMQLALKNPNAEIVKIFME